ncbi:MULTISPECIES: MFS transporter [unclassified Haladaptatus]|uniref:MFS transporter n=1 Tax=unclassified Haladaptatus TaxID=2622732 RepID=UPI0023E85B98|nr:MULTISPECIES: MFS transporter [unclassified Haladaptatus]
MSDQPTTDRVQRLLIGVAAGANKGRATLMGTAMAVYVDAAGGSPFAVSLVFTVYWFGLMAFAPVAGAIADITGRRRTVLVVTTALATLAILPLAVVDGVWGPLAFRGLFAVFAAGFLPVMLAIVSERGGTSSRGQSIGFFNSTTAIGFTLAQFFAGVLLGLVAPWALYLIVAAVSAITILAALFITDPRPPQSANVSGDELLAEVRHRLFPAAQDRRHLRSHGLRWLYAAVLLRNMTILGTSSLLPVYLLSEIGVSQFVMGVVLAINPAAQMGFMYLFGHVADSTGRKPLVVYGMAGAGLHTVVVAAATLPSSVTMRAAAMGGSFLILAAAYSAETTGTYAFIGDVAPVERESELMGLHSTARGFGGMAGPPLVGALATWFTFEFAFAAASVLAVVATLLVWNFLVESHPESAPAGVTVAED